jgi:hypothetical protein
MRSAVPSVRQNLSKCTCPIFQRRTIRTEEQKLRLPIQVNDRLLDAWSTSRNEKVDDGLEHISSVLPAIFLSQAPFYTHIYVFLKAELGIGPKTR